MGCGSGFSFPVRRREDAEGNRDAGFKVQVGDLSNARGSLLLDLPMYRKEDKKIPLASFEKKSKKRR